MTNFNSSILNWIKKKQIRTIDKINRVNSWSINKVYYIYMVFISVAENIINGLALFLKIYEIDIGLGILCNIQFGLSLLF